MSLKIILFNVKYFKSLEIKLWVKLSRIIEVVPGKCLQRSFTKTQKPPKELKILIYFISFLSQSQNIPSTQNIENVWRKMSCKIYVLLRWLKKMSLAKVVFFFNTWSKQTTIESLITTLTFNFLYFLVLFIDFRNFLNIFLGFTLQCCKLSYFGDFFYYSFLNL